MGEIVLYQALYNYSPSDEEKEEGYIDIEVNDLLEVTNVAEIEGSIEVPESWLTGTNTRTRDRGLFPGTYVKYVRTSKKTPPLPSKPRKSKPSLPHSQENEYQSMAGLVKTQSSAQSSIDDSGYGSPQAASRRKHVLTEVFFVKPILCGFCKYSFMWIFILTLALN
ncbi:phosphatidylinositol 3-kinase regulatory subunit alpha-like [Lingula anatina]|uniref:Phosphatidylinositol 3-kinase regulatory subunit alpha-like n=1 Tax=Lingula anatina TaxID=7574 RepID=A0A1S3IC51_LINAN|nr:phosphatidylinositol 3-kinase regulatory subunit alpha-like [Lingula anatina]XP_023933290.1 phosphatidylinositol 3-kinase regulatory subunit alpha-like [Lingula anatina]|eukprot:XP_013395835.1 phosphatidylinositol 3-kinase regulatory subunit alpha-like [Lingula anatina]